MAARLSLGRIGALLLMGCTIVPEAFAQAPPEGTVTVTQPPEAAVPPPVIPPQNLEPPVAAPAQPPPPPAVEPMALEPTAPATTEGPPASAEPQPQNGVAGWYPGFAIKSLDDKFKLRIGLQAAYRFEPYWVDGDSQNRKTFFVLRPLLEGHIFEDWIRFWTSFEFAANPPFLLDSYVEIQPKPFFGVRVGQQFTPYSRHEYLGPQQILFPEWAPVAEYFWTGRDKGVTAMGTIGDGILDYWAGVYSGTPLRQFTAIDGNYVLEARVTVSPMGPVAENEFLYITSEEAVPFRYSFTLQGYYGNVETGVENFNDSTFRFDVEGSGERRKQATGGADFWLQGPCFTALVEANIRRTNPDGDPPAYVSMGLWGQVGFMLLPRLLDVGIRGNVLDASDDLENDLFFSIEGQFAYYPVHTQNLVLKLRYGYAKQKDPGVEDAPLFTSPGDHHLITAQLGLAL